MAPKYTLWRSRVSWNCNLVMGVWLISSDPTDSTWKDGLILYFTVSRLPGWYVAALHLPPHQGHTVQEKKNDRVKLFLPLSLFRNRNLFLPPSVSCFRQMSTNCLNSTYFTQQRLTNCVSALISPSSLSNYAGRASWIHQSQREPRWAPLLPPSLLPPPPPPPEAFERSSVCVRVDRRSPLLSSSGQKPHAAAAVPQSRTRRRQERTPRASLLGFNREDLFTASARSPLNLLLLINLPALFFFFLMF